MNRSPSRTAIVGIGCRFPGGARDPESFWELLNDGTDPISRLPQGRFDVDRFLDPTPGTPGRLAGVERRYSNIRFLLSFVRFLAVITAGVGVLIFIFSDASVPWTMRRCMAPTRHAMSSACPRWTVPRHLDWCCWP